MAKSIEPKLKKIGEYLKIDEDVTFVIPEYQRAYSWGVSHCDKLWQDINDYINNKGKDSYFFGTIIINCQDNDSKYALIDGQQRTTTFLLLLKALLIRINIEIGKAERDEDSSSLCRGLKERRRAIMRILYKVDVEDIPEMPDVEKDVKIYSAFNFIENKSINEQYEDELTNILKAVNFEDAENRVIKLPRKQKDNKYTNFFKNFKYFHGKISTLSAPELNNITKTIIESCEVIEIKSWQVEQAITMFNSLNSDGLPLYDSDIISAKLYAAAEADKQGDEFKKLWELFIELVNGLEEKGIANIDSILMQHMYYVRAHKREVVTESGSINVTTPGLRRYFTEVNKEIIKQPIEMCQALINLAKIWGKIGEKPLIKILLKSNENSKLFMGGFFYRFTEDNYVEKDIEALAEVMLRLFSILELVDAGYSSAKFKTFLFGESVKIVDKNVPIAEIIDDFNKHINASWSKESLKDELLECDSNILVYLNEYLFAKEKSVEFSLTDKCDIEHIMPNSGHNLIEIRKDAGIASEDEFKEIVNKLGNKILLEYKINRSIGNEWFRTKVSTNLESKTGYVDSVYPIATALVEKYKDVDKPYWKKEDINIATEKAADRIIAFIFN